MIVLGVVLAGAALGALMATLASDRVSKKWQPVYAGLQVAFGVLVVLGAWYHSGIVAIICFAALLVTSAMLYAVFRIGRGYYRQQR